MRRRTEKSGDARTLVAAAAGLVGGAWLLALAPAGAVETDLGPDRVTLVEADPRFRAEHPRLALHRAIDLGIVGRAEHRSVRPVELRRTAIAIVREARRNALDPALLAAVAHVESRFRSRLVSPAGARGVLQVTPDTARHVAATSDTLPEFVPARPRVRQLHDVETNVALGANYLAGLKTRFGSESAALVAYNQGPTKVRDAPASLRRWSRDRYVRHVLAERTAIRAARLD